MISKASFIDIKMDFKFPQNAKVIRPNKISALDNTSERLRYLLRNPIGARPLREIVKKNNSIAIVICDKTRSIRSNEMLSVILDELTYVNEGNISIVVATGTHKPNTPEELGLSKNIIEKVPVYNHDSKDSKNLVSIGFTSPKINRFSNRKRLKEDLEEISSLANSEAKAKFLTKEEMSSPNEVKINKIVAEADVKILLGNISPHYFAGFSGGIKSLIPGVANKEYIIRNHFLKAHPSSRLGVLNGNIVREDLEEASKLCRNLFCVNAVLNEEGKAIEVVAGDSVLAHRQGVDACKKMACVKAHCSDIVIAFDKYPVNINVKQVKKVVAAAARVAKPNGVIIVLGRCEEGLGSHSKVNNFIYKCHLRNIMPSNVSLILVSDVPEDEIKSTGFFEPMCSLDEALRFGYDKLSKNVSISILPYGSLVIPVIVD